MDFRDERRGVLCRESLHPCQSLDEYRGHLGSRNVPRDKNEGAHSGFQECRSFNQPMLDMTILSQDSPSILANFWEPVLIARILGKEVIVDSHIRARGTKGIGYYFFS